MRRIKFLCVLLAMSLLPWSMAGCAKEQGGLTVLDAKGSTMLCIREDTPLAQDARQAYLQIVLIETAQLLAQKQGCTDQQALEQIFAGNYTVCTAFDPTVHNAMAAAITEQAGELAAGCAITDLGGNLLAAYSTDTQTNYATEKTPPYSSFKPLSVYLPAVESGKAEWFTGFEDSPVKQVQGQDGTMQDWPQNSTATYSGEMVPVYKAVAQSLNTVAVKCLSSVGVENSMQFLQEKLGIPLEEETYVLEHYGPKEVLGNIALGYLETGVSPVDMAGYYQIFGNGGIYTTPQAVTRLLSADGTVLYEREYEYNRVTTPAVADIMNRLLQGVVSSTGTGTQAGCSDVQVAGKTGTGDDNEGNWFVGLIPGYSCAVWHGSAENNRADELFSAIMQGVFDSLEDGQKEFYPHDILHEVVCCAESGMAISENCTSITLGYFLTGDHKEPCRIHK